jgi:tetratricopeptide (TPR) repeat protein
VFVVRADPLSPDRGKYAFSQSLLRTVAYEMLSRRERKSRHVAAAEHLRAVFPDDGEDVAEVVAHHYLDAYQAAQEDSDAEELRMLALAALRRAGQRAATIGAPGTAEQAYRNAAGLAEDEPERLGLTHAAADAAMQAGSWEVALELFAGVTDGYRAAGLSREAAGVASQYGRAMRWLGRIEEDIELVSETLALLGVDALDPLVAELNGELGTAMTFAGRYDEAVPALERSLQIAEALGMPDVLCAALSRKALLSHYSGRSMEARILYDGGISIAEEHGLTLELQHLCNNCGDLCLNGDLPGAAEYLEKSLALARRLGNRALESLIAGNIMLLDLLQGRWEQVERLGVDLLGSAGDQRPEAEHLHERLGALHALRGETDEARRSLEQLAAWDQTDNLELLRAFSALAGAVAESEGDHEEALRRAGKVARDGMSGGAASENVRLTWPVAVDAAFALGRLDEAAELIALIADRPPGHVPPYMRAQVARARGLLAVAQGRHDAVESDLVTAVDALRALGYPYWLARAQTDLAAWLIDRDRDTEAQPLLDDAIGTLEGLGAAPALARARDLRSPRSDQVTA